MPTPWQAQWLAREWAFLLQEESACGNRKALSTEGEGSLLL